MTGLDPAVASLDVARSKPGATGVTWLSGAASDAPPLGVDVATMTGNAAQVFLTDTSWASALLAVGGALDDEGHFVFESRDPAFRAWEQWTRAETFAIRQTVSGSFAS